MTCVLLSLVAFGGLVAFLIPGGLYSFRLASSERPAQVAQYNTAVDAWTAFRGALYDFTGLSFNVTINGTLMAPASPVTGAPAAIDSNPPLAADGELSPYPTALFYSATVPINVSVPAWGGDVRAVNVTISPGASTNSQAGFTVTAPLAFTYDGDRDCSGVVVGNSCVCKGGTPVGDKCRFWAILRRVCLGVEVRGGTVTPSVDLTTGSGCEVMPILPGYRSDRLQVQQLDGCVPSTVNNVGPFGYDLYASDPVFITIPTLAVTIRSGYDPYITAISVTHGALSGGAITFGTPLSTLASLSAGMWGGFAGCVFLIFVLVVLSYTQFFDPTIEHCFRSSSRIMHGLGSFTGLTVAFYRKAGRGLCKAAFVTIAVVLPVLSVVVGYGTLAIYLLESDWVCAYRTVCGQTEVLMQCGTFSDLKDASAAGTTFRGLGLAALVLAMAPIVLLCGCFAGMGAVGSVGVGVMGCALGLVGLCWPVSAILQIAAAGYYASNKGTMFADYCRHITTDLIIPSECRALARTESLFNLQTVLGTVLVSTITCSVAYAALSKRK